MSTISDPTAAQSPSAWRAWCYLVWLSWQRQARARQMVWLALGLLAFAVVFTAIKTAGGWWSMRLWRFRGFGPAYTYSDWLEGLEYLRAALPWPGPAAAVQDAVLGST